MNKPFLLISLQYSIRFCRKERYRDEKNEILENSNKTVAAYAAILGIPQPFNADIERKTLVSITGKTNKQNTKCGYGKRELDSTHKTR